MATGTDPRATASAAKLRYVSDGAPGIARVRTSGGFGYRHPDGSKVTDPETLIASASWSFRQRMSRCGFVGSDQHSGAADVRGRKAPLPRTLARGRRRREIRQDAAVRQTVAADKSAGGTDPGEAGLPREKVLAAIVRSAEATLMRVGNAEYARTNKSYGSMIVLRNRHVKIQGSSRIQFDFAAKRAAPSGTSTCKANDWRRSCAGARRCRDRICSSLDDNETPRAVTSTDVNDYLGGDHRRGHHRHDFRTQAGRTWRHWRCANWRRSIPRRKPSATWSRRWRRSRRCWATRPGDLPQMLYSSRDLRWLPGRIVAEDVVEAGECQAGRSGCRSDRGRSGGDGVSHAVAGRAEGPSGRGEVIKISRTRRLAA